MGTHREKRQVVVYLTYDLHKELKKLAADRDTTISDLVEVALRREYPFAEMGLIAAETPTPFGRSAEKEGEVDARRRKRRRKPS